MKKNKILFVSDLNEYGRGFQRFQALQEIGCDVVGLSFNKIPWLPTDKATFVQRALWKIGFAPDTTNINGKIKNAVSCAPFDVVWIEKGVMVLPSTLRFVKRRLPRAKLVQCSEDDMYAKHNRSHYYVWGLKYFDVVFTTKTYNLEELKRLGAKRTELFLDSYNEHVHKPMQLTEKERERFSCDVSAIGAFEKERAESLMYLAEHGIKVVVWGSGWHAWTNRHENLMVKDEFLFGMDYAKAISATKINLNFLRKVNRDEVTSRSIEIPACGGFMLAERTKRHLEFFKEGKEAEFFGSNEELLKKINYYLVHDDERTRIAAAGRARCFSSGYSMKEQLKKMMSILVQ